MLLADSHDLGGPHVLPNLKQAAPVPRELRGCAEDLARDRFAGTPQRGSGPQRLKYFAAFIKVVDAPSISTLKQGASHVFTKDSVMLREHRGWQRR